jgi:16S rRNA (uracil1498-N3)-methyltransferase
MAAPTPDALRAPITTTRPLAVGDDLVLEEQHLLQLALREINVKEAFTVVDGRGAFFRASLKSASKTSGGAVVYEQMPRSTESPARITLLCAVLGRQRMITVVQKATELGCVRVVPVLSEHAVPAKDLDKEKPWAWPGQSIRACRQCRRASVPEVLKSIRLEAALAAPYWKGARARFVLDDRAGAERRTSFPVAAPSGDYALAVGPEGGWSEPERARLEAGGAVTLALGGRVLRAETAVYAGLTLLQHRLGDMNVG